MECIAFPKVYDKIKQFLTPDTVVRLGGKIDIDPEKAPVIILDSMQEFIPEATEETKKETAAEEKKEPILWLDARKLGEEDFEELIDMMSGYEGGTKVCILHGGKRYEYAVNLNRAFAAEVRTFLPENCIKLVG